MWVLGLLALLALAHVNGLKTTPNLQSRNSGGRSSTATEATPSRANTNKGQDNESKVVKAVLTLADGTRFEGISFGAEKPINGEVVFTTGMVGYTESLTDPSYRGQVSLCQGIFIFMLARPYLFVSLVVDSDPHLPHDW